MCIRSTKKFQKDLCANNKCLIHSATTVCACVWLLLAYPHAHTYPTSVHLLKTWYLVSSPQTSAAAQRTAPAEPGPYLPHLWPLDPLGALRTLRWGEAENPAQPWPWTGSRTGCSSFLVDLHWAVGRIVAPGFNEYIQHTWKTDRQRVRQTGRQAVCQCLFLLDLFNRLQIKQQRSN